MDLPVGKMQVRAYHRVPLVPSVLQSAHQSSTPLIESLLCDHIQQSSLCLNNDLRTLLSLPLTSIATYECLLDLLKGQIQAPSSSKTPTHLRSLLNLLKQCLLFRYPDVSHSLWPLLQSTCRELLTSVNSEYKRQSDAENDTVINSLTFIISLIRRCCPTIVDKVEKESHGEIDDVTRDIAESASTDDYCDSDSEDLYSKRTSTSDLSDELAIFEPEEPPPRPHTIPITPPSPRVSSIYQQPAFGATLWQHPASNDRAVHSLRIKSNIPVSIENFIKLNFSLDHCFTLSMNPPCVMAYDAHKLLQLIGITLPPTPATPSLLDWTSACRGRTPSHGVLTLSPSDIDNLQPTSSVVLALSPKPSSRVVLDDAVDTIVRAITGCDFKHITSLSLDRYIISHSLWTQSVPLFSQLIVDMFQSDGDRAPAFLRFVLIEMISGHGNTIVCWTRALDLLFNIALILQRLHITTPSIGILCCEVLVSVTSSVVTWMCDARIDARQHRDHLWLLCYNAYHLFLFLWSTDERVVWDGVRRLDVRVIKLWIEVLSGVHDPCHTLSGLISVGMSGRHGALPPDGSMHLSETVHHRLLSFLIYKLTYRNDSSCGGVELVENSLSVVGEEFIVACYTSSRDQLSRRRLFRIVMTIAVNKCIEKSKRNNNKLTFSIDKFRSLGARVGAALVSVGADVALVATFLYMSHPNCPCGCQRSSCPCAMPLSQQLYASIQPVLSTDATTDSITTGDVMSMLDCVVACGAGQKDRVSVDPTTPINDIAKLGISSTNLSSQTSTVVSVTSSESMDAAGVGWQALLHLDHTTSRIIDLMTSDNIAQQQDGSASLTHLFIASISQLSKVQDIATMIDKHSFLSRTVFASFNGRHAFVLTLSRLSYILKCRTGCLTDSNGSNDLRGVGSACYIIDIISGLLNFMLDTSRCQCSLCGGGGGPAVSGNVTWTRPCVDSVLSLKIFDLLIDVIALYVPSTTTEVVDDVTAPPLSPTIGGVMEEALLSGNAVIQGTALARLHPSILTFMLIHLKNTPRGKEAHYITILLTIQWIQELYAISNEDLPYVLRRLSTPTTKHQPILMYFIALSQSADRRIADVAWAFVQQCVAITHPVLHTALPSA